MYLEELLLELQDTINKEDVIYFTVNVGNTSLKLEFDRCHSDGEITFQFKE